MKKSWFEIGRISDGKDGFSKGETMTVFRNRLLSECLQEFKKEGYSPESHFIDIWEADSEDATPEPVGAVHITKEILAHI